MEYYRLILCLLFGVLPSLAWLFYYLTKDLHPEPKRMIVTIFFYGALVTIPVFLVQVGLAGLLDQLVVAGFFDGHPIIAQMIKWFLVIALTEEFLKYLVVKLAVLNNKETDEPLDIMLYMVVAALGFAAVENILYLFSPIDSLSFSAIVQATIAVSFVRFIGATFLHTLCSALIGYFIVIGVLRTKNRVALTMTGLFLAALLHGLYDFSIMTLQSPFTFAVPILIIICLAIFVFYDFDEIKKVKSICKL